MDLREYQVKARSTAIYPRQGENLPYTFMGLVGEWGEFREKSLDKEASKELIVLELGDVLWYVANLACEAKIELIELDYVEASLLEEGILDFAIISIGKIGEALKKTERDDNNVLTSKRKKVIENEIKNLLFYIDILARDFNLTLLDVAERNIQKLLSREKRDVLRGDGDER